MCIEDRIPSLIRKKYFLTLANTKKVTIVRFMEELSSAAYWEKLYKDGYTGWDIGHVSGPMRHIIDQLHDKALKILVPGAGNGYEVAYLHQKGFSDVYLLDWAITPLKAFAFKYPGFPKDHLLHGDFFLLEDQFDLVLEQTFFCALNPELRPDYVQKMSDILRDRGSLQGVFFKVPLYNDRPPFGGSIEEYHELFAGKFTIEYLAECFHSDPDRFGKEAEFRMIRI